MLEKVIKKLLATVLGNIVEDFTANEIQINKWIGTVEKSNLVIKESFVNNLFCQANLPPVKLKKGIIGNIKVDIPWTRLNKQPIKITIEDFFILLNLDENFNQKFSKEKSQI